MQIFHILVRRIGFLRTRSWQKMAQIGGFFFSPFWVFLASQAGLCCGVFPTGIEPAHPVPETGALSTELRERHAYYSIFVKISQGRMRSQMNKPLSGNHLAYTT